jgi:uncharacterized membrane protein
MSLATSATFGEDRNARWLLLVSLALNLFFIGAGGALLVRHYAAPAAVTPPLDRSVGARIERLAATLPAADADILRSEYRANASRLDAVRDGYRSAQDEVRRVLRAEPFDPEAMRTAMTATRTARQGFDQMLQDVIAAAAAKMSVAGRNKLADWPPGSQGAREQAREVNR